MSKYSVFCYGGDNPSPVEEVKKWGEGLGYGCETKEMAEFLAKVFYEYYKPFVKVDFRDNQVIYIRENIKECNVYYALCKDRVEFKVEKM